MDNAELPDECCGRCFYVREMPVDPNVLLQRQHACVWGPPQSNVINGPRGAAIIAGPPPVDAVKGWCGQFRRRQDA